MNEVYINPIKDVFINNYLELEEDNYINNNCWCADIIAPNVNGYYLDGEICIERARPNSTRQMGQRITITFYDIEYADCLSFIADIENELHENYDNVNAGIDRGSDAYIEIFDPVGWDPISPDPQTIEILESLAISLLS